MDKVKLAALHLATARQTVDATLLPLLEDADQVESSMSKTDDGYVYEIRYKAPGKVFRMDALSIITLYKDLKDFISLDGVREQLAGLATHVGRLADKLEGDANRGK